jgi:hypothetical protein
MMAGVENVGPEQGYGYAQTATETMRPDIPQSVLRDELMGLHSQLDRLELQASRIRGKLEPVLRMTPEQDSNKGLADITATSEFTREIRRAHERVAVVAELLISTIDQLDV